MLNTQYSVILYDTKCDSPVQKSIPLLCSKSIRVSSAPLNSVLPPIE